MLISPLAPLLMATTDTGLCSDCAASLQGKYIEYLKSAFMICGQDLNAETSYLPRGEEEEDQVIEQLMQIK